MKDQDYGAELGAVDDDTTVVPASGRQVAIEPGAVFTVAYPFQRGTYEHVDFDPDGSSVQKLPTWQPGIYSEYVSQEGDTENRADGVGLVEFSVISVHKPGKYPTRVFYVRSWVDPDGKRFGKPKLRITVGPVFLKLTRGYGYEYRIKACAQCEALPWYSRDHRGHAVYATGNQDAPSSLASIPSAAHK